MRMPARDIFRNQKIYNRHNEFNLVRDVLKKKNTKTIASQLSKAFVVEMKGE
jgi:hypothetical protein